MLRAAYFAQELLSTFSTALGEVALQPSTGGRFVLPSTSSLITGCYASDFLRRSCHLGSKGKRGLSWFHLFERKTDIETKVLKQLVRDIIEPQRDLGHSDRKGHKAVEPEENDVSIGDRNEKTAQEKNTPGTDAAS